MRTFSVAFLGSFLLIACKVDPALPGATEGGSSGGEGSTTDDPTTTTTTSGGLCVPGQSVACACPSGDMGAQVCNADGKSFGECMCDSGGSNSDSQGNTTTTTDPGNTTTTTDPGNTTTTTDPVESTGAMGSTGVGSTGPDTGGVMCNDPGPEPNEEQDQSVDLGMQSCEDEPQTLMGVLNGDADVDWFTYQGAWTFGCGASDPDVQHTLTASETVRLCVFADCNMGETQFDCQDQDEGAPNGAPGCCNQGDVSFVLNCGGTGNESARIWVRLDQAPADSCVDYSVEYSYLPV